MLDWLGEGTKAVALESAVAQVIKEGKARTYDMGGTTTTLQMAEAIARKLNRRLTPPKHGTLKIYEEKTTVLEKPSWPGARLSCPAVTTP